MGHGWICLVAGKFWIWNYGDYAGIGVEGPGFVYQCRPLCSGANADDCDADDAPDTAMGH